MRLKQVPNADRDTLILEVAIVEMTQVGMASPRGTITIEGRVRDGRTGIVIGMFADRRFSGKHGEGLEGDRFLRIAHIRQLLKEGALDSDLRWRG